jgi:RHS repeat-associated protein
VGITNPWYRQHRTRPCKERKNGAPTVPDREGKTRKAGPPAYTTPPIFSLCYDFHLGVPVTACNLGAYPSGNNGSVFQVLNNVDSTRSAAYIYDPLNRIAQAYTVNTNSANCWGETYSPTATAPGVLPSTPGIDAWGNLINRSGVTGMAHNCITEGLTTTASTQNQLSILTYDAAGNVTNDGLGNTPTYDAENRIATDAGYTYSYDADGMRMEKTNGSSGTMYWPGPDGEVLTETDLTGTINEEYAYFNGERIARIDRPSGTVHYYFSNHLGSASVITDANGNVEEQTDFFPFGGIAYSSGSDSNRYKFTGKERDSESNLDNFGARYFAYATGRFMTPDWAARPTSVPYAVFGDPQSLNLYGYVRNDPVTLADADGHDPPVPMGPLNDNSGTTYDEERAQTLTGKEEAQNTAADKPAPQPAPTDPNTGKPTPPPVPVPGAPDLPWKWNPNDQNPRGGDWGPDGWKGPNPPHGSWDPDGHWDIDKGGKGPRDHYDPQGNPITPGQAHPGDAPKTMMDRMRSITPGPILKWGTAGVVIYIIIDEGSRLYPPRNLVPVP